MGHEITAHDKQQGREMAWHGLTDVQVALTLATCWLASWDYIPQPVKVNGKDTPFDVLGVSDVEDLLVGRPYDRETFLPISNHKLIELLDKGTIGKDLILASCGTIKARGCQFFSFEMGESYKSAGREFKPYFNTGNGNDQSSTLWQNTSCVCTVCANTYNQNTLTEGVIMEVKKTKFSELKLADFGKAIKAMLGGQQEFAKLFESLARVKATEATAREFFAGFVGTPGKPLSTRAENIIETLIGLYRDSSKGNSGENFSDVFSAITDYYTHESAGGENNWKQFVSSEFGSGNAAKVRAWSILNDKAKREAIVKIGRDVLKKTNDVAKALASVS